MKSYTVNGEDYCTICSVHTKIIQILTSIKNPEIQNQIKEMLELTDVALKMGQNMEDAIKYKNIVTCGTVDFYSFQKYMNNEIEED